MHSTTRAAYTSPASPAPKSSAQDAQQHVSQAANHHSDEAESRVGQRLAAEVHSMTDAERELHIRDCNYLLERAYEGYMSTGCLSARGEADRWRVLRDEAIRGRSPAMVARMEVERGLR